MQSLDEVTITGNISRQKVNSQRWLIHWWSAVWNSSKNDAQAFGLVKIYLVLRELALATALCCLLVFPPAGSVLDRLTAFIIQKLLTGSAFTSLMLHKGEFHMVHRYHGMNPHHLQCDVAFKCSLALHVLVPTATRAAPKWDTGRHVDVLHLSRVLLLHVHQLLHGPTHAPHPHLLEPHHSVTPFWRVGNLRTCQLEQNNR